jgi:NAD(P)-dependent dehydrogenase (short-subunit alcohol dehydrogenase family)
MTRRARVLPSSSTTRAFGFASLERTTDEQLHKMLDTNLWGTIVTCREPVGSQRVEQTQREVLVEKNPHDAWRTAGGKCVAICAA